MLSEYVVAKSYENSILQVTVIYGKHKTNRLQVKKMYKFNKQQINNELRPNDFNKDVSITQKTNPQGHTTSCELNILAEVSQRS